MVLKQRESTIGFATSKKNLFVLDIQTPSDKAILTKERSKSTYLLNKNLQIRLWHQQLEYASNAKIVIISKLVDRIDITIDKSQQEECFSSDFEDNNKNEILEPCSDNFSAFTTTLLNKITNTSSIDLNDNIEQLYDSCIKSKHTKIVRHKKMTLITCRL